MDLYLDNLYTFIDDYEKEKIYFDEVDIIYRVTNYKFNFYLNGGIVYDLAFTINKENENILKLGTEEELISSLNLLFSLDIKKCRDM